jgi:hypothetical protein
VAWTFLQISTEEAPVLATLFRTSSSGRFPYIAEDRTNWRLKSSPSEPAPFGATIAAPKAPVFLIQALRFIFRFLELV